tara:strand:- start:598 stop:849 length:252 start_codon:yes stop_codon:yes gene_type:complete
MNKYSDKEQVLLKSLSSKKINLKDKGTADLEVQIETLKKEIDTLKTIIDLKDMEISKLKENDMNKFLNDLANNTPNSDQFEKA